MLYLPAQGILPGKGGNCYVYPAIYEENGEEIKKQDPAAFIIGRKDLDHGPQHQVNPNHPIEHTVHVNLTDAQRSNTVSRIHAGIVVEYTKGKPTHITIIDLGSRNNTILHTDEDSFTLETNKYKRFNI